MSPFIGAILVFPLRYMPWTLFNAQLRYWQNYIGRPVAFSVYGQQQIYIGPVPDQSYLMEVRYGDFAFAFVAKHTYGCRPH
jgi:hypothetical protein